MKVRVMVDESWRKEEVGMEGRKQFTFYRSYYEALMRLPASSRGKMCVAIMEYGLFGKEPEGLTAVQSACFILIKPTLDAGIKRAMATGKVHFVEKNNFNKGEKKKEIEIEIENETETETERSPSVGFETFWNLYPLKLGKESALKAWKQLGAEDKVILDGLDLWLNSAQWRKEEGRFIPRPAKFLKEKYFLDHPGKLVLQGATGVLGEAELEAIRQVMEGV